MEAVKSSRTGSIRLFGDSPRRSWALLHHGQRRFVCCGGWPVDVC